MNILSKATMRKKYSKNKAQSAKEIPPFQDEAPLVMKKRKNLLRKNLTLSLTDFIAKPEETYDINNEYKFLEKLGFGTYSQVQRATRLKDGTSVAIKICSGSTSIELLKKEKLLLEELDSEFFPQIFDFKVDKVWNKAYLVMEHIKGETLDNYIRNCCKIPKEIIEDLICQL